MGSENKWGQIQIKIRQGQVFGGGKVVKIFNLVSDCLDDNELK
jgi:hypothetical protein